jgi:hypothetical protein
MKIDKTFYDPILPYPYLPNYTGTITDRQAAFQIRLRLLLKDAERLQCTGYSDLVKLEKAHQIIREMIGAI